MRPGERVGAGPPPPFPPRSDPRSASLWNLPISRRGWPGAGGRECRLPPAPAAPCLSRVFIGSRCGACMAMQGNGNVRGARTVLGCAPEVPQGAVLLEASVGLPLPVLRALPDAPLADIGRVLFGCLMPCSHPHAAGWPQPAPCAEMRACSFWAWPHALLDMHDTLEYALRYSDTLYLAFVGRRITLRAHWGVDAAGMWDNVEVVGDKYALEIGEFSAPPWDPEPLDWRLAPGAVGCIGTGPSNCEGA